MVHIQRGDTSAFSELYNRYSQRLLHFFYRLLGRNEQQAQDFLQDTFLKILEKSHLFHPDRKFSTWVFTIAMNLCKNEYRRLQVRKLVDEHPGIDEIRPLNLDESNQLIEMEVDCKLFHDALTAELEKLHPDKRSVFLLRFQQEFSIKEIGDILGCSEGTVKSRIFYTIQKLAQKLKAYNMYQVEVE